MKYLFSLMLLAAGCYSYAQELYIYTEPASNVPAKSTGAKLTGNIAKKMNNGSSLAQRYRPEVLVGVSKNMMIKASISFADMATSKFTYESFNVYGKYRFLSKDEAQKHFRMAAFAEASVTRSPFLYDEISLMGDKTGAETGVVATQLLHKLAVSATLSHTQVLDKSRFDRAMAYNRPYQSFNYSLSAGYLLFPMKYENFNQTNVNLYTEFLAQQTLDKKGYYIDAAPGLQFIFNSNSKLNLGYRFQLGANMSRMTRNSFQLSFERTFFGAL